MQSLKYLMFPTLVCKDMGIRKSEFVAKTQFLYNFNFLLIVRGWNETKKDFQYLQILECYPTFLGLCLATCPLFYLSSCILAPLVYLRSCQSVFFSSSHLVSLSSCLPVFLPFCLLFYLSSCLLVLLSVCPLFYLS